MLMRQFPSWMETSKAKGAPSLWLHRASWYHYMAQCVLQRSCSCARERETHGGKGRIDNTMFTFALYFWDRASIQPCCDTHHMSNLVAFIITLYSQRPHLACYYQRSLLFPSMYVWSPSETNMSNADNSTILVDPIVYIILRVYSLENSHQWFLRI